MLTHANRDKYMHVRMQRGYMGSGPPPPPPEKLQVIWVSIEMSIWTPQEKVARPLENVGPPLNP